MSNSVNDMLKEMALEQLAEEQHKLHEREGKPELHPGCYPCRLWLEAVVHDHSAYESGYGEAEDEN